MVVVVRWQVGYEADHIPVERYRLLSECVSGDLVDVSAACMQMRMVKSEEEIRLTRAAARIASLGGWAVCEAVRQGVTEYEVALAGAVGNRRPYFTASASDPPYSCRHTANGQGHSRSVSPFGNLGYLGLVPVRNKHRRSAQSRNHTAVTAFERSSVLTRVATVSVFHYLQSAAR